MKLHSDPSRYKGHKVVCTSLDKAANTIVVQFPRDYVNKIMSDLEQLDAKGTYTIVHTPEQTLIDTHNNFLQMYGIGVEPRCQNMPYYIGNPKLHKTPPATRFICSSATSFVRPHSI